MGLQKDAPDLLEGLIDLEPEKEGQRLLKMFGLADFMMAAYATPYWVIEKGVYRGVLEAAKLYQDIAEGKTASPIPHLPQMHFLYFVQLVMRDNYGYEFLAKALENTATKLIDGDTRTSAYAIFLVAVAYIDAGRGQSFDWLLEDFKGELPLDLRLAVGHEGDALKARNKAIKRLRSNIRAAFKDRAFYDETKKMYEQPIGFLAKGKEIEAGDVNLQD